MFMKKHSSFTPFIAHSIMKMAETGIIDLISKRHTDFKNHNCDPIQGEGDSLGMEKFAPLFALYIVGCIVSIFALMIENISKRSFKNETIHIPINTNNIWNVSNVSEFLKYCCPECEFKCDGLNEFHMHANEKHEFSIVCFQKD